jgi:hypothetical protein
VNGRARRAVAAVAVLAALLPAGCTSVTGSGSLDAVSAYFGPAGPAIATVDQPSGTPVPTPAEAARLLLAQFPDTAPGVSGAGLAAAREIVVRILSRLHVDQRWLCGTWTGKDPVEAEFPPGGRWQLDPKTDPYRKHHAMYQLPGCDQARLSAVYIGDQRFTVSHDGADVQVKHVGVFTYDTRALRNGVRLPVHAEVRRTFVVHRFADGWHLSRLFRASAAVAPGYGKALPRYTGQVPGLQQGNLAGQPDPAGVQAVRAALAATLAAGSARLSFEDRSTAPWRLTGADQRTGEFWPKTGDAEYRYPKPARGVSRYPVREFVIGRVGDYLEFSAPDETGRRYTQFDPRLVPDVAGIPADSNPYTVLAAIAQLNAASPTACQRADQSDSCWVVHIPVARLAVTGSLATRMGFAYAAYGFTDLTLKVGLAGGRISLVSQDAIMPVVGHGVLAVHWRFGFTGYADTGSPPALTVPPAAQVTRLD